MDKIHIKQVKKEIKNAINKMAKEKGNDTYYWTLGVTEDNNRWAIVLGWQDGFDAEENDQYLDGTWRICMKLAYQSVHSSMQCDYDTDWYMPFDKETGEVDDTEISIDDNTSLISSINWLFNKYAEYETKINNLYMEEM